MFDGIVFQRRPERNDPRRSLVQRFLSSLLGCLWQSLIDPVGFIVVFIPVIVLLVLVVFVNMQDFVTGGKVKEKERIGPPFVAIEPSSAQIRTR